MLGASRAMFCSPHPYGILSKPSKFFRARPMMSPAQTVRCYKITMVTVAAGITVVFSLPRTDTEPRADPIITFLGS